MRPSEALRYARKRAELTQRQLAQRSGVAQPAVARIEKGAVVPRVDTMERLLRACGQTLEVEDRIGAGVDRSVIRELLRLSPKERIIRAAEDAENLHRFLEAVGRR
jgi:predicted transcriptional regulator